MSAEFTAGSILALGRGVRVPLTPSAKAAGSVGALVEEALGAVFARDRCVQVIAEALRAAGHRGIPEQPAALREFLEGDLFAALVRYLPVADALEVLDQIRSAVEPALASLDEPTDSDVRRRAVRDPAPTTVLVASGASLVVFLLADILGDDVQVIPVANAAELAGRLREARGASTLVVVDRRHPCVDLAVCSLLREELGPRSTVVWWSADPAEQASVSSVMVDGPRAIVTDPATRLADLGDICRAAAGRDDPQR